MMCKGRGEHIVCLNTFHAATLLIIIYYYLTTNYHYLVIITSLKVFSTGSAALSSMALMCAFSKATNLDDVSVLNEVVACARSSAGKLSVK
jgi:hypothetical protein